jgi:hypothetical protein
MSRTTALAHAGPYLLWMLLSCMVWYSHTASVARLSQLSAAIALNADTLYHNKAQIASMSEHVREIDAHLVAQNGRLERVISRLEAP